MTKVDFFDSKTCTLVGLVTNVALAVFKLLAGIFGFSYAMIADAVHSFSDCVATATCYVGIRIGERPADESHPYGHANAETIAAFLIALTILGAGIFVAVEAIQLIVEKDYETPAVIALIAAVISIVIKEGMFRYTLKVGERNNSPAVIACAWDHRSDAYSSVAVLLGILGARLGFPYLDPVAGLAVSALIVKMSLTLFRSNIGILMDERPEPAVMEEIKAATLEVKGIEAIDSLKVHRRGSAVTIDIEVAVDCELTVERGHQIAAEVKSKLLGEVEHVQDVMVHVNPYQPGQTSEMG